MNAHTYVLFLAGAMLASACAPPRAEGATPKPAHATSETARHVGAVILVRTPRHLSAAMKTAREGLADPAGFARYRILVCGEAVSAIQVGSALEQPIREAVANDVQISACGMSLTELHVDATSLVDAVDVVPNALAEALRLQSLGWASVEL